MIRKSAELKKLVDSADGFFVKHFPIVSFITADGKSYRVARNAYEALSRKGYLKSAIRELESGYRFLTYVKR